MHSARQAVSRWLSVSIVVIISARSAVAFVSVALLQVKWPDVRQQVETGSADDAGEAKEYVLYICG